MNATPEVLLVGVVAAVGVLHTVVPDHWVPITLVARQQGWTKREVSRAALLAGTGHTVSTLAIGLVVWIAGVTFATKFGNLVSTISSFALIAFGGWIAVTSLRDLTSGRGHGHSHGPDGHHARGAHDHGQPNGFHGTELARIVADHDLLELSIYESAQPPHFRLSGHRGDRVWVETIRDGDLRQRFDFTNRGAYWESIDEIPEPHGFTVNVNVGYGDHMHTYATEFAEHEHGHGHDNDHDDDRLYMPSPGGTTVLAKHAHVHRHGTTSVHVHLHDHGPDTWHRETTIDPSEPPAHEHRHKRSLRTSLLLILGSSPMVEGIPAFFAAGKYGIGLIAIMALVFAFSTIATYVLLCVTSVASLQRITLGPLERYGEVLSGAFIAIVGVVFLIFPIL